MKNVIQDTRQYDIPLTQRTGLFNTKQDPLPTGFTIIETNVDYRQAQWKEWRCLDVPYLPVIDGYSFISKRRGCEANHAGIIIHNSLLPLFTNTIASTDYKIREVQD